MNDEDAVQVERDGLERYWRAVELADGVRAAWEAEDRPLTVKWPNGTVGEAPLLKLLRAVERDAERFARVVPKLARRPGPNPVAVVSPSPSPAAKLRSVNG